MGGFARPLAVLAARMMPRAWRAALLPRPDARSGAVAVRRPGQWQDVFSGLTPQVLRQIVRSVAVGGDLSRYLELAEQMEERDLHYRSVLQQRRLAIASAPFEVRPAGPDQASHRIADDVRRLVDRPDWHDLTLDLLDALGKGFAAVEVVWRVGPSVPGGGPEPAAYERIDPRWIAFDSQDGRTPLLRDWTGQLGRTMMGAGARPMQTDTGPAWPIPRGKAVVHTPKMKSGLPARGGLAYAVCAMMLLKSVAVRDWWAYAEIFGLPLRVGRYPRDATEPQIQTLVEALANLASDAGCALPEGMEIEFPTVQTGGQRNELFERMARWCDSQVSKAVIGATMLTDDGSSKSQADVHLAVRDDLIEDDQRQLLETLNGQIIRWFVDARHGPQAAYPRLARPKEETVDVAAVERAVRMGLPVPVAWMHERMGIPAPTRSDAVLTGRPPGATAPGDGEAAPGRALAALLALDEEALAAAPAGDEWAKVAARWTAPIRTALATTDTPEAFVAAVLDAGVDLAAVEDLALRTFEARVDGATDDE